MLLLPLESRCSQLSLLKYPENTIFAWGWETKFNSLKDRSGIKVHDGRRILSPLQALILQLCVNNCMVYNSTTMNVNKHGDLSLLKIRAFWDIAPSWWWRQYAPLKRLSTPTRLHGVTSQKSLIFIPAAVRNWNLFWFRKYGSNFSAE
jgi:hypothetical protein